MNLKGLRTKFFPSAQVVEEGEKLRKNAEKELEKEKHLREKEKENYNSQISKMERNSVLLTDEIKQLNTKLAEKEKYTGEIGCKLENADEEIKSLKQATASAKEFEEFYSSPEMLKIFALGRKEMMRKYKREEESKSAAIEGQKIAITHWDCDGVCASAIIKQLHKDIKIVFSNPKSLHKSLSRINAERPPEKLFLLDLPVTEQYEEEIKDSMYSLYRKGTEITIITDKEMPLEIEKYCEVIFDERMSTSQLCCGYVKDKNVFIPDTLGYYGSITDGQTRMGRLLPDVEEEAVLVNDAVKFNPYDYEFLNFVADKLIEGKLLKNYREIVNRARAINLLTAYSTKIVENNIVDEKPKYIVSKVHGLESSLLTEQGIACNGLRAKNKKSIFLVEIDDSSPYADILARGYGKMDLRPASQKMQDLGGKCWCGHSGKTANGKIPKEKVEEFFKEVEALYQ